MNRYKFLLLLALVILFVSGVGVFIWDSLWGSAPPGADAKRWHYDERILLTMGAVSLSALLLSAYSFCRLLSLRQNGKLKRQFDTLSRLIASAEFSPNNGVLYIDHNRRILAASSMMLKLAGLEGDEILGKSFEQVFTSKFARLLFELQEKAMLTRRPAAAEISDWLPYSPLSLGPVRVIATPSIEGGNVVGFIMLLRSAAELKLTEESAQLHQQNYQVLLDTLNIGVAVFRPAVSPVDGGADAYLVEANAAFKKMFEGVSLPYNEPCSVVWPSYTSQPSLREGMVVVFAGGGNYRFDFFSSVLCKYLAVNLAALPGGHILATFSDQTETRLNENQVLQLNDQLQRTLGKQSAHLAFLLQDIEQVNAVTADQVQGALEHANRLIEKLPPDQQVEASALLAQVDNTLSATQTYYEAARLPYKDNYLVYTDEIFNKLQPKLTEKFPTVRFVTGKLPALVASPKVMEQVMERLLSRIASMPSVGAARVEVGEHTDFLSAGIYVAAWGFDTENLFVELPNLAQPLDWSLSGDLDLATIRRMVVEHGGQMSLVATDDGGGFRIFFTIGSPA